MIEFHLQDGNYFPGQTPRQVEQRICDAVRAVKKLDTNLAMMPQDLGEPTPIYFDLPNTPGLTPEREAALQETIKRTLQHYDTNSAYLPSHWLQ